MFRARRSGRTSRSSEGRSSSATPPPSSSPLSSPERDSASRRSGASNPASYEHPLLLWQHQEVEPGPPHAHPRSRRPDEMIGEAEDARHSQHRGTYSHLLAAETKSDGELALFRQSSESRSFFTTRGIQPQEPRGRPLARQEISSGADTAPHPVVQLRPQDARRSRRRNNGQSLFLSSSRDVVLALPGGRMYSQSSRLGPSRSSSSSAGAQQLLGRSSSSSTRSALSDDNSTVASTRAAYQPDNFMSEIIVSVGHAVESPEDRRAREHAKKERQVARWGPRSHTFVATPVHATLANVSVPPERAAGYGSGM